MTPASESGTILGLVCTWNDPTMRRKNGGLSAPFPWYGGKRQWAKTILERLGDDADSYVEPFAGSLAVLLHKPEPYPREIVCDIDGMLCNFWRAVKFDPEQTAYWADWPTVHFDLTARHKWLVEWGKSNIDALKEDPEYFDAKVAGWWCWGVSNWIGGGFCEAVYGGHVSVDQIPHVTSYPTGGGQGVQVQRKVIGDQIPHVNSYPTGGGQGVQVQRKVIGENVGDKIPQVNHKSGGRGVQAQRKVIGKNVGDKIPQVNHKSGGRGGVQAQNKNMPTIGEWFEALSCRLGKVVVLNRGWKSAISKTILGNTKSHPGTPAVFLDPPYLTSDRKAVLYESDKSGGSDVAARESYEWAVGNGNEYRIAYACHEGDFEVPEGWDSMATTFKGVHDTAKKKQRDMVMFSPACLPPGSRPASKSTLDRFF